MKPSKQDNDAMPRSKTAGMSLRSTSFSTRRPNNQSSISIAKLTKKESVLDISEIDREVGFESVPNLAKKRAISQLST